MQNEKIIQEVVYATLQYTQVPYPTEVEHPSNEKKKKAK